MIDEDTLAAYLDTCSPFDIGCIPEPDSESNALLWFRHPDFDNIVCKFGQDRRGRLLRVWLWLPTHDGPVILLTADLATPHEIACLERLQVVRYN